MSEELSEREGRVFSIRNMFSFLIPLLEVIKVIIASVASVIFIGFAALTLAGTAVGFAISTPIFVIFSPILVPAGIATAVLTTGLTAGGSFLSTAVGLIVWLIKRRMGIKPKNNPPPALPNSSPKGFMFPVLNLLGLGRKGLSKDEIIDKLKKGSKKLKGKVGKNKGGGKSKGKSKGGGGMSGSGSGSGSGSERGMSGSGGGTSPGSGGGMTSGSEKGMTSGSESGKGSMSGSGGSLRAE